MNMKVKKLVKLLKEENQDAEIFAYLGAKNGFKVVKIGQEGGAILGKGIAGKDRSFVLIPIEVPNEFEPWAKGEEEEESHFYGKDGSKKYD